MVILVDHSRNDGFSADGSQVGHVSDGDRILILSERHLIHYNRRRVRGGVVMIRSPSASNTSANAAVKTGSRS